MGNQAIASDPFNKIWDFFTSVRLTIVILLTLAATSIIGTLIPQNQEPADYFQAFGGFLYRLFDIFGLFDMYHSWWFQLLIVLLTINIIVCSIDRISANRRILFVKKPTFSLARFRNFKRKEQFKDDRSTDQLQEVCQAFVKRNFRHSHMETTDAGYAIYGEKGRWTRFGVYTVHLSVVLLLVGGLIGSIFGFDGWVNIPEGESVSQIRLRSQAQVLQLDFEIRCDDFDVSFYDTGAPKEFRSSLTILEQGREVVKKDIIVNDPLRYKGVNMFQSSYGQLPSDKLVLSFTSTKTGMIYSMDASPNQLLTIPEKLGTFVLKELRRSAKFKSIDIGDAYVGILTPPNGDPVEIILPARFPSFDKMRKGEVVIAVAEQVQRFYTGLQVTRDPGVWVVYSGFILMIIGCYITFFMSHQQMYVELAASGKQTEVIVAGTANKNKTAMVARIKAAADKLAKSGPVA
jgi:cytochrome c biogenesis protein